MIRKFLVGAAALCAVAVAGVTLNSTPAQAVPVDNVKMVRTSDSHSHPQTGHHWGGYPRPYGYGYGYGYRPYGYGYGYSSGYRPYGYGYGYGYRPYGYGYGYGYYGGYGYGGSRGSN